MSQLSGLGIWLLPIALLFLVTVSGVNGKIDEELLGVSTASDTVQEGKLVHGININFSSSSMVLVPAKSIPKKNKSITGNDEECICLGVYTCAKLAHMTNTSGFVKNHKVERCIEYLSECCISQSLTEKPKKTYLKRFVREILFPIKRIQSKRYKRTSLQIETIKCTDYNSVEGQKYGKFPWTVSIYDFDRVSHSPVDYLCSGTLIHPQVVLTTAHCPIKRDLKADNLLVRAGELDFKPHKLSNKMLPHQDRRVSKIVEHEHYSQEYGKNDVALILLMRPFNLQHDIGTICLPPQGYNINLTRCRTTDWVTDEISHKEAIKRRVEIRLVPRKECEDRLRSTELGSKFRLHDNLLCGGGGEIGNGLCMFKPDDGTPLTCPVPGNPQRFFQLGIYTWRIGCNNSSPNVYVAVSQYRDWIDANMADFDRSYYVTDHEF